MMLDISLQIDSRGLDRFVLLTEKNIRYAAGLAMKNTVVEARKALQADLRKPSGGPIIGGATPWTVGAAYARFPRPDDLTAEVGLRADQPRAAGRYISVLTKGGRPRTKGADIYASAIVGGRRYTLVPTPGQRRDARGNVSRANFSRALENPDVRAAGQAAGRPQGNGRFFVVPLKKGQGRLGLFERTGRGRRNATPRFTLEPTPKPRASTYDLKGDLNRSVQRYWPGEIREQLQAELRRAGFG